MLPYYVQNKRGEINFSTGLRYDQLKQIWLQWYYGLTEIQKNIHLHIFDYLSASSLRLPINVT